MSFSSAYGFSPKYFGDADYQVALTKGNPAEVWRYVHANQHLLHGKNQAGHQGGLYERMKAAASEYLIAQQQQEKQLNSLPDYSDQLDDGVDQDAINAFREEMEQAAKDQRKRERRALRAQQTQAANAERAGQMAQFKIGTQTPSGQTGGTGQFKTRLKIKPVTSSTLSIAGGSNKLPGINTMLNV